MLYGVWCMFIYPLICSFFMPILVIAGGWCASGGPGAEGECVEIGQPRGYAEGKGGRKGMNAYWYVYYPYQYPYP
ncbi:hypothetical protein EON63_18215 [archaeon]|nr:MAG: hypothetical protein EON63_18215 [archaeon]